MTAREVRYENDHWIELADTRLLPGETATITLDWEGSDRIRAWLEVIPDYFYGHQVFPGQLAALPPDSVARALIQKASAAAEASAFRLFETELRKS